MNRGTAALACGLLVMAAVGAFGCDGGGRGPDSGGRKTDTGEIGPVDAASQLCADFCRRQSECELANPDCLAFCSRGERNVLKQCVVEASDCAAVEECLAAVPPDAGDSGGMETSAKDADIDVGMDVRDGGVDVSDDASPADTGDAGSPADALDSGEPADTETRDSSQSGGDVDAGSAAG